MQTPGKYAIRFTAVLLYSMQKSVASSLMVITDKPQFGMEVNHKHGV
jgi:hypothetical protein